MEPPEAPAIAPDETPATAMATPAHDDEPQPSDPRADEADTCRICRGEGSAEEPLFYPCKCSGSIKYVHQECLMEWLSHTQKKHCELCKTSFRFTKLYHPGMPNRIPTTVFVRRAALHVLNMFVRGVAAFWSAQCGSSYFRGACGWCGAACSGWATGGGRATCSWTPQTRRRCAQAPRKT